MLDAVALGSSAAVAFEKLSLCGAADDDDVGVTVAGSASGGDNDGAATLVLTRGELRDGLALPRQDRRCDLTMSRKECGSLDRATYLCNGSRATPPRSLPK